jgi:hypothetical protein
MLQGLQVFLSVLLRWPSPGLPAKTIRQRLSSSLRAIVFEGSLGPLLSWRCSRGRGVEEDGDSSLLWTIAVCGEGRVDEGCSWARYKRLFGEVDS